jgi:hypothetical protein
MLKQHESQRLNHVHKWMSTGPSHEVVWVQVGSTEWVEQNIDLLGLNAVAYLNLDTAVGGSGFSAGASPQLDGLLQEVTKQVSFANSAGDVLLLLTILIGTQVLGLLAFT